MITTKEVSKMLGVNEQTLYNWRKRGFGPKFLKLGKGPHALVRYRKEDIEAWIEESTKETRQE